MEKHDRDRHSKGGAPRGNANAQRHGLRSAKLPKGCRHVGNATAAYRRSLEAECKRVHGRVTVVNAGHINSAVRHETTAMLLESWLRKSEGLTLAEQRAIRGEIDSATELRDRAVARLNLDSVKAGGSVVDDLYGHEPEPSTLNETNGRDASCDESTSDDPTVGRDHQNAAGSESRVSEGVA